jgi:hypothetical protein
MLSHERRCPALMRLCGESLALTEAVVWFRHGESASCLERKIWELAVSGKTRGCMAFLLVLVFDMCCISLLVGSTLDCC